ncbi:MAG: ribosome assembly protein 4 (RSA4) [uncultured bacterium]|nr:MAG: ribosome assembly protein 4 (RSA4) [uncultured bacterium]OGT34203.1 MAG: hypothetical protein A3C44_03130 [Gammaproteobacteria bacterium RIFCSPHIGHO2_02_FULL_39_13]OGT50335.1 MAG: hypothetical protein A3E53_01120 [Gammaproteobacteria bacterium RIFCSPHIGHO2_12_FULL_39_24]
MDYFPITIAHDKAFCNRVQERCYLKELITARRHTVVIAPRRYGKTSLIAQCLSELKMPHVTMELTLVTTAHDVEKLIANHVSAFLYTVLPKTTKAKTKILKLFQWLNPQLTLTAHGQSLQFKPDWQNHPTKNIAEILKKLNEAAKLANKKMVIVMDEFQQLSLIDNHTIEASIRHAMQYSTHISYIFSGSHRHMLLSMFNNKNQPFYNSCEILSLTRIHHDDYVKFIQHAAKEKWHKNIPLETLNALFELTEYHPNYINRVCGYLWLTHQFPTTQNIHHYWDECVQSKQAEFSENILSLSANQKRVFSYLARHPTKQVSDHDFCNAVQLPEASVRQAVKVLLKKDYLQKNKEGVISVLDPAMKSYLNSLFG